MGRFFDYLANTTPGISLQQYFTEGTLSDNYIEPGSGANQILTLFPNYLNSDTGSNYYTEFYWILAEYPTMNVTVLEDGVDTNTDNLFPGLGPDSIWNLAYDDVYNQGPLPATVVCSGFGDENADDISITFKVTLTFEDETELVEYIDIPPSTEISDATSNPIYFESLIANKITSEPNDITCYVTNANTFDVNGVQKLIGHFLLGREAL